MFFKHLALILTRFSLKTSFFALFFVLTVPAHAMTVLSEAQVYEGQVTLSAPFFEDRTDSRSPVQAEVQFNRLGQEQKLHSQQIIDVGSTGGQFWLALDFTNNSSIEKWRLEFSSLVPNAPSPIKSVSVYNPAQPEKPLAVWPDTSNPEKLSLPLVLPHMTTTMRYVLVETWPGINNPLLPVLKTNAYAAEQAIKHSQKISLLWLIMGAVFGVGLVQLILTRQGMQGLLAVNALIIGGGVFLLQRPDLVPGFYNLHPVLLPMAVAALIGMGACLIQTVASNKVGPLALICCIPLAINIILLSICVADINLLLGMNLTVEKLPHFILSMNGLFLMGATIAFVWRQNGIGAFIPAWMSLAAMPWIAGDYPFASPMIYAVFLGVAGVASVFSFWKSLDQETEALQRRLKQDLQNNREKYEESNLSWERKLENQRLLLTELRQREQQRSAELEIAKREADAANKAKSDFLAIISHEIRTPMNGIMGIIDIIMQSSLNDKLREYVEVIKNSGETMVTLLNDILDYSKIEKGVIELENIGFSLRTLVNSVAMLMSGRAKDKGLSIDVQIASDVPDGLMGDPNRIRQVLLNLVSNAIKFTESGGVVIRIQRQPQENTLRPGIVPLLFEVIDTGVGIPKDVLDKLFQAYMQADASITRRFGGTGLGLNICRMLVSAMNGTIDVVSTPGQGSTFWFSLPLQSEEMRKTTQAAAHAEYAPERHLRVLTVDDNKVNLKVISGLLEMDGHHISISESGDRALQMIEEQEFDIVFVDMLMPGMDGKTFVAKLRQNAHTKRATLPVYALTGLVEGKEIEEARASGIEGLITKPVTQAALRAAIDHVIGIKQKTTGNELDDIMSRLDDLSSEDKQKLLSALSVSAPKASVASSPPLVAKPIGQTLNTSMLSELKTSLPADTFKEIFIELIDKAKELVAGMQNAVVANNMRDLTEKAHNLKGMAGNFGLKALMDITDQVETMGRANDNGKAVEAAQQTPAVLEQTLVDLDEWLRG